MNADDEIVVAENLRKMGLTVLDVKRCGSHLSALFFRGNQSEVSVTLQCSPATADTTGVRHTIDQGIAHIELSDRQPGFKSSA